MSHLVSPNEMMEAAKAQMLEGREPQSEDDWLRLANFIAFNVHPDIVHPVLKIFKAIYDIPLTEEQLTKVADYQLARR